MRLPPDRRRADRFEPRRDLVVRLGRTARSARPDDDLAARPRCLQLDLALHRGTKDVEAWATPAAAPSVDADELRRRGGSAASSVRSATT